jgi:hypothetical protein
MRTCTSCGAAFGPAERRQRCFSCGGGYAWQIADKAVTVLEQADVPLPHWDIKRLIDQKYSRVHPGSLLVSLSGDPRTCWGGKGIYGLYRHGLLPRVRDLGTIGAIYLYASGATLHYRDLWFAMRHAGYKSTPESVYYGLRRVEGQGLVDRTDWGDWHRPHRGLRRSRIEYLLGASTRDTREILGRADEQLQAGLVELERRLNGRPTGATTTDA